MERKMKDKKSDTATGQVRVVGITRAAKMSGLSRVHLWSVATGRRVGGAKSKEALAKWCKIVTLYTDGADHDAINSMLKTEPTKTVALYSTDTTKGN